jgi:hypothetical protein
MFLYSNWLSEDVIAKDANQTVVALTVKKMLISVTTFFFLYYLAFLPMIPLSMVNNIKADDPIPVYDSTFNQNLKEKASEFLSNDIKVKLPLLWASMDIFTYVATKGFLNALPKTAGDVRAAIAGTIKNKSIKTPFVRNQYAHFYNRCFLSIYFI